MIKTLQRKFIVTAMIAVSVLLILLLSGINVFNAWTTEKDTTILLGTLLKSEADQAPEPPNSAMNNPGFFNPPPSEDDKMSAVFFTVRFDSSGNVAQVDVSHISSVTEADAKLYAETLYQAGRTSGKSKNFKYASVPTSDGRGSIYLFLDVSSEYYAVLRVVVLSAFGGVVCWVLMLLLVFLLSKKAIRPIAENIQKQKQFVTDAGHEFKTPLAIMLANLDAMELHNSENKWSKNIREQIVRLNGLIQNLLTLAKSDESKVLLGTTSFSLSDSVNEILRAFTEPMQLKNLTLHASISPDLPICANKEQILQLISILIDNAVKYSIHDGLISLSLQKSGKMNILQIENVCETLPECKPDKLFDRFYRANTARTQKSGGYGIGLSAAQAIVLLHHGTIRASYDPPNKIIFTVKLPEIS